MQDYIAATKSLCDELEQLHLDEPDINNRTTKAAKLIRKVLTSFRKQIYNQGFQSEDDEIHFFKYVKPRVNSYLIFFSVLAEIETEKLLASEKELTCCIEKKERMFRYIMRENREFVTYYRAGLTHLDRIYFLRGTNLITLSKHSTRQLDDPEFNTSHDGVAANILAFDLFQRHLSPKPELPIFNQVKPKLKWTANKLDLVELIYALQASGALNYGDADLKDICSSFEQIFQIKVGDLYRSFHDISNRKKQQVKFVNTLEKSLKRKIEELDEYS